MCPVAHLSQLFDASPTTSQRLGSWTVFCLVANRTIGSGLFAQPYNVLRHLGGSGQALLVWFAAGLIVFAISVCWVELGMSVPFYDVRHNGRLLRKAAPRSGGDKNYVGGAISSPICACSGFRGRSGRLLSDYCLGLMSGQTSRAQLPRDKTLMNPHLPGNPDRAIQIGP